MSRIDTDKDINPTQLGIELGRVPVRHVAGRYVDAVGVGEANLREALDAHVADPDYIDPEYVAPPARPSVEDRLTAVENRLDRAAQAQVTGDAAKVRDGLKPTT